MRTADEIRKACDEKIKILQSLCPHEHTQWAEEAWAPAHFTGRQIKYCVACEKHLEYKGSTWTQEVQEKQSTLDFENQNNNIMDIMGIDLNPPKQ